MKVDKVILTLPGCPSCEELKKNGMCEENKCISVSTKTGNKLAVASKSNSVPQCIKTTKNGKVVKCDTNPIIKKFTKKKK